MSYYLKHPEAGNRHVASLGECEALQADGWTKWPRTKAEKEGRQEIATVEGLINLAGHPVELPLTEETVEHLEQVTIAPAAKRRGRPPKVR